MPAISITDNFGLTADLVLRDDSALAHAKLTTLVATAKELFTELDEPLDQAVVKSVSLGATATEPDVLASGLPTLKLCAGVNCGVTVKTAADGTLLGKDPFLGTIAIGPGEGWVGVELDVTPTLKLTDTVGAFGLTVTGGATVTCTTWTEMKGAPLPLLKDALGTAFSNYGLLTKAADIRGLQTGTLSQASTTGTMCVKVTAQVPFAVNALATAGLPFGMTGTVEPDVTVAVTGTLAVTGEFLFQAYKTATDTVRIGLYKKKGTTLTAAFAAGAVLEGEIGSTDWLSTVLNAALPGVDTAKAGIDPTGAKALNGVIKKGVDRSVGAQLNASCSAALTDEAAVLYEVRLTAGDAATDAALEQALRGDWTGLAGLKNAKKLRDVVQETVEKTWSVALNLFGVYTAVSTTDYVKQCTVMLDESGQLSVINKAETSRISAQAEPYASDTEKLRTALMQDFLATATYAVVGGKVGVKLAVTQSYLDYARTMSAAEMRRNVQLGYELQLIPAGTLDAELAAAGTLSHASVSATVSYDTDALMRVFFKDVAAQTPWEEEDLETAGRNTMGDFMDPNDPTDEARAGILDSVQAYADMDDAGSKYAIVQLPELAQYSEPARWAIAADWVSIRWWADAMVQVAPALKDTLAAAAAVNAGSDWTKDPALTKQRTRLANVLGAVTRNTDAAFVGGWGEAVMFGLSGHTGKATMRLAWNSVQHTYGG